MAPVFAAACVWAGVGGLLLYVRTVAVGDGAGPILHGCCVRAHTAGFAPENGVLPGGGAAAPDMPLTMMHARVRVLVHHGGTMGVHGTVRVLTYVRTY